jgi:DNA-binding beta-propeller fold protein YncE
MFRHAISRLSIRALPVAVVVAAFMTWPAGFVDTAKAADDDWATPLADTLGVRLVQQFDSSGEDAWDPNEHPNVFITTEGPGYGGLLSGVKLPGIAIIDSDTREVVAHQAYDVLALGWKNVFEPHGLGVSSDGQWIYLPSGEGSFSSIGMGRLLIINARTLKLDKILGLRGQPHHAKSFIKPNGKALSYAYGWAQPLFVMDPADDNRVVGGLSFDDMGIEGYLYFAAPAGDEIIASGRFRRGSARNALHGNVMVRIDTANWKMIDYVPVTDSTPVWVAFAADGKNAYFSGGHSSQVFKYDTATKSVTSHARAGVEGPYGIHLGWDDKFLYAVGKGEGSHNRGKVLGLVNTDLMEKSTRPMDQFTTDCIRGDHATLHPDPDANELWITCNSSFEIVVFDLDQNKVSARIPMPNGGSTHSGSFVAYDGWDGEVVADQNGLQGSALALKRELLGLTGAQAIPEDEAVGD